MVHLYCNHTMFNFSGASPSIIFISPLTSPGLSKSELKQNSIIHKHTQNHRSGKQTRLIKAIIALGQGITTRVVKVQL